MRSIDKKKICPEVTWFIQSWILQKVRKFTNQFSRPGKSLMNFLFWQLKQVQLVLYCGQILLKILSLEKTFNGRQRSLRSLLPQHCIVVTVCLQCIMGQTIYTKLGSGKVFNFATKNLCEPCEELTLFNFEMSTVQCHCNDTLCLELSTIPILFVFPVA